MKQAVITLDLEGVLVPEIWIAVAEKTGIEALRRTTRDEPDYDVLMRQRLAILGENNLKLSDIQSVIAGLSPLPGAKEFLDDLPVRTQVLILSDTFLQFANPLMRQLDWPTLFCNHLEIEDDRIVNYHLRQPDQKKSLDEKMEVFHASLRHLADGWSVRTLEEVALDMQTSGSNA